MASKISKTAARAVAKVRETSRKAPKSDKSDATKSKRDTTKRGAGKDAFMSAIEAGRMKAIEVFKFYADALAAGHGADVHVPADFFQAGLQLADVHGRKGAARYLYALGLEAAARALFTRKHSEADEAFHFQGRLDAVMLYLRDPMLLADQAVLREWLEKGKAQLYFVMQRPEYRHLYSQLSVMSPARKEELYAKGFLRAVNGALQARKE